MKGGRNSGTEMNSDRRIDAALHEIGMVAPEPGLEERILTRLAAARVDAGTEPAGAFRGSPRRLPRAVRPLLGFACASMVCAVIVAGSVVHSRRGHGVMPPAPPVMQAPGTGVGAASAIRPGAPASAPVPAGSAARGRSSHSSSQGRARIAPHAHKAAGVAVPAPPAGGPQN